jgi:hypothetical protein
MMNMIQSLLLRGLGGSRGKWISKKVSTPKCSMNCDGDMRKKGGILSSAITDFFLKENKPHYQHNPHSFY